MVMAVMIMARMVEEVMVINSHSYYYGINFIHLTGIYHELREQRHDDDDVRWGQ